MTIAAGLSRILLHRLLPAMALAAVTAIAAHAGGLDDIRARGVLAVGAKADYRPFGFRDDAGAIVGFEPDLAAEIAKALGVELKLVPVVATNRVALLQSGEVDLLVATMNVTPERSRQVDFVEPSYYASGVSVLAPKSAHLQIWQQLRGRAVCSVEGAAYLHEIKDRYAPDLHLYRNTDAVYAAVKSDECYAAYDDTALIGQLQMPGWENYEMPLRSVLLQPWGMAVKPGNVELASFVGALIRKWHADGHVEQLEGRWHIPPSVFAEEMHRRYADAE
jgi:polar amino acid transport system substrate-binding protein